MFNKPSDKIVFFSFYTLISIVILGIFIVEFELIGLFVSLFIMLPLLWFVAYKHWKNETEGNKAAEELRREYKEKGKAMYND